MAFLADGLIKIETELKTLQGGTFTYGNHVKGGTVSEMITRFFEGLKLFDHEKLTKFTIVLKET